MRGNRSELLLRGVASRESVRALENRFGISVLVVGCAVGVGNLVGRVQLLGETVGAAAADTAVWATFLSGVLLFGASRLRVTAGRWIQAGTLFAMACVSGLESSSGNLTSLVFFGLAILLAGQYGVLHRRGVLKFSVMSVAYGLCLAIGTYLRVPGASIGAILNLVGAGFIAYLFVVIASIRLKEMTNRQSELERMVDARTKDLREEADRRKVAEQEARATAEKNKALAGDREVLLRELHHRSKNDLQMIFSLLSLRAEKGDRPELVELFRPTQDRIRAIALVHEQLDGSERFDAIGLRDYLEALMNHLQVSHREYPVTVRAEIDSDLSIRLEPATHVGLLIHELILCSYTYSFGPGQQGRITLVATIVDGNLEIHIGDDGEGLPDTIDPASPDDNEIQIVEGLVRRLDCRLSLDRTDGTHWHLEIPLERIRQDSAAGV